MAVMMPREKWTDERLDDLNTKVDKGFEKTERAIAETKAEIAELRREMKEGFEGLHRLLFKSAVAMIIALLGFSATLVGALAF
jgi:hypothetical protein